MASISKTNLIINYLPQTLSDKEFKFMFSQIAEVKAARIVRDRASGYSKGFGFVEYFTQEDALRAISTLNGKQMGHKTIKVAFSRDGTDVKGATLYVKNLPATMGEREVKSLFSPYGDLIQVRILKDQSGTARGTCFVLYNTKVEANNALEKLSGWTPQGANQPLSVQFSDEKKSAARPPEFLQQNMMDSYSGGHMGYGGRDMGGMGMRNVGMVDQMDDYGRGMRQGMPRPGMGIGKAGIGMGRMPAGGGAGSMGRLRQQPGLAMSGYSGMHDYPMDVDSNMMEDDYYTDFGNDNLGGMEDFGYNYSGEYGYSGGRGVGPMQQMKMRNMRYNPMSGGAGVAAPPGSIDPDGFILFVYNIGPNADEFEMHGLFSPYGKVTKVNVIRDFQKKQGKGYAFITMVNYLDAQNAIKALNGHKYHEKPLQVSFKKD